MNCDHKILNGFDPVISFLISTQLDNSIKFSEAREVVTRMNNKFLDQTEYLINMLPATIEEFQSNRIPDNQINFLYNYLPVVSKAIKGLNNFLGNFEIDDKIVIELLKKLNILNGYFEMIYELVVLYVETNEAMEDIKNGNTLTMEEVFG
ncbi:MAG: hypothetical protein H8D45_16030 [Bacteroidetes bacterium]|nr:hypothetical protein [Bacteroidota bacterium]MBL7104631.1 hypothetical protein [Bacteroidales bacterium]